MKNADIHAEIGRRLYQQRKKLKMTQEKTAELLEISPTYYGAIERGEKRLSLEKILMVYQRMGLDPTYLLTGKAYVNSSLLEVFETCPKDKQDSLEQVLAYLVELSK